MLWLDLVLFVSAIVLSFKVNAPALRRIAIAATGLLVTSMIVLAVNAFH